MMKKSRWFVLTIFDISFREKFLSMHQDGKFEYLAYGSEICPSTGREHLQSFVYFKNPKGSVKNVSKMFGNCHVEIMHGSISDNENYCSKESKLTKIGTEVNQGKRNDLNEIKEKIMSGTRVDDLILEVPVIYHQYGRTLHKIEDIYLRQQFRKEMTKGFWYYGKTGVGKSHKVFEDFDPKTHYVKNLDDDWWDGYTGQPIVILNEFRGQLKFSLLLELCDKFPLSLKRRNREPVPFIGTEVRITSCSHPKNIYNTDEDDKIDQLLRRFSIVKMEQKCSKGNTEL